MFYGSSIYKTDAKMLVNSFLSMLLKEMIQLATPYILATSNNVTHRDVLTSLDFHTLIEFTFNFEKKPKNIRISINYYSL